MYARSASILVVMVLLGWLCGVGIATSNTVDPHAIMQRMGQAYDGIQDYTALFLKRERINGTLQELETIELRFQEPFKLYMAWQEPHKGRALTYIEGENDNKMLVNPGGFLQFVHLSLDPNSPLATRNAHHTVRQAGLRHTINLLMREYQRGMQQGHMPSVAMQRSTNAPSITSSSSVRKTKKRATMPIGETSGLTRNIFSRRNCTSMTGTISSTKIMNTANYA